MRYPQWIIDRMCKLRSDGMSYSQVAKLPLISRQTVMRWYLKYKKLKQKNFKLKKKDAVIKIASYPRKINGKIINVKPYSYVRDISKIKSTKR